MATGGRSMFPFGSGRMFLQPTGTLSFFRVGVAAMQEGGWSLDVDVKELHGANRWPVDVRTGTGKIEGTAKFTDWDGDTIAAILGVSTGTSVNVLAVTVSAAIVTGTLTITPTPPNSGTFYKNLEVIRASNGVPFVQVTSPATVANTYSVNASTGAYTFVAGDAADTPGTAIKITFAYTLTGAQATSAGFRSSQVQFANVAIGTTPVMAGIFQGISDTKQMVFELDQVVPYGIKWASRLDDWSHQDISLKAFASPLTDVIGRINLLT